MLDFANVDEHQNISVCCVGLQLSKLSFRAFPPYNIWCSEVLLSQTNCIYTECPLADCQWICNPSLGQPPLILIPELFVLACTGCLFLGRAQHISLLPLSMSSHSRQVLGTQEPSPCWCHEPRASKPPVQGNAMKSKEQMLILESV